MVVVRLHTHYTVKLIFTGTVIRALEVGKENKKET
jgi:hypothetical protein